MSTPHTRTHQTTQSTPSHIHTHTATGGQGTAHTHTGPGTGGAGLASQLGGNTSATGPGGAGPGGPARGLFPPPPPYYLHYTHENLHLHAEQQRLDSEGHHTAATTQTDQHPLPPLTPPPPLTEPYSILSTSFQPSYVRPTLASAGIPTLSSTPPQPRPLEIRKLVVSAAFQHARLLDALAQDPQSQATELAVDRLQAILVNAMHALGEYREHQALETLRLAMEKTVWESRHVSQQVKQTEEAAREVVDQALRVSASERVGGDKEREATREAERAVERLRQGSQDQGMVRATEVQWWARDDKDRALWDVVKSM